MPIPFIIGGLALAASAYGVKKGVDGYRDTSEADRIVDGAKTRSNAQLEKLSRQEKKTDEALEQLGRFELEIGSRFEQFSTLAESLLEQLNQGRQEKLRIELPKHQLEKIERYSFTAVGFMGSLAGAGAAGAAAGFAVYGGVMSLAAASTGTAISALSGAAATNATLAAIGGGALSAGGLGIAGGTAILGAAVAAPVLAIAGWAYAGHGEEALRNARKAEAEADASVRKMARAESSLERTERYAHSIKKTLTGIFAEFEKHFGQLKSIDTLISSAKQLGLDPRQQLAQVSDPAMRAIQNGYAIAAILTDLMTVPLFKVKTDGDKAVKDSNGVPVMDRDGDGSLVLDTASLNEAMQAAEAAVKPYAQA